MLGLTYALSILAFFTYHASAQSRRPDGTVLNYYLSDQAHVQNGLPGRDVDGSYGFVTPEGTAVTVNYIADENGYRAQVFTAPSPTPFYTPIGWSPPSATSAQKRPGSSPAQGPAEQPRPGNQQSQGSGQQQPPRPFYYHPASYNPYHPNHHNHNRYWYERCRNSGQYNCHRYAPHWHYPHRFPSTFYRPGQF